MIALEFISDRLRATLAEHRTGVPVEAADRIRELEAALAAANARLITEGAARDRLDAELPALSRAIAALQEHFDRLIIDARAEIPPGTVAHVADMEKRFAAATAELGELRKERDGLACAGGNLEMLRDAALQWRKDAYSPRLQAAIDTFSRRQVSKR